MVKDILDGISIKLNQVFGSGYEIYGDTDVVQGLQTPCFFIAVLQPSQEQMIGNRYFRQYPFDISFFPTQGGDNVECYEVAEDLLDEMEAITLVNGDVLRGTKMQYEIVDDVLHFKVNYNMFTKKIETSDAMETVEIDSNVPIT